MREIKYFFQINILIFLLHKLVKNYKIKFYLRKSYYYFTYSQDNYCFICIIYILLLLLNKTNHHNSS